MAADIVSFVLRKLGEAAIEEAILLYGVKDQMEFVKRELVRIQCFLKDADSKRKGNNGVENWVKDVRNLCYLIEDAIDTFLADNWRIDYDGGDRYEKFLKFVKQPMKLIFTHKLGNKIKKIQARIKEISASRETYGIKDLGENNVEVVNPFKRPIVVPDIDEDIVGIDVEKNDIIKLLLDDNISKRRVVSIVGQGGLGKTTLARKIYNSNEVKRRFEFRAWLTISKEFQPIELLKNVLRMLRKINEDEKDRDESYFAGKIRESLSDKNYLVVLDDIWENYAWSALFEQTFPDMNNGSRLLITTRFSNVATTADNKGVHNLRFLTEKESIELLLKKAFPNKDDNENYSPDLVILAEEYVKSCGGLPLALVVLGGLLSIKPPNPGAWDIVRRTMDWLDEGNECMEIIATSYKDLPLPLKQCFIYLALFPEDYKIPAEMLIKQWVAEGFISEVGHKIMEDIAENYLEELAQRCMIQVSERSSNGSIMYFQLHDLLLELAIHEAKEKEFSMVFSKKEDRQSINAPRRATFQLRNSGWQGISFKETKLIEYANPKIRTLIFYGDVMPFGSTQFKLIRVLCVDKYYRDPDCLHWWKYLKRLPHLRCLMLEGCGVIPDTLLFPTRYWNNLETFMINYCDGVILHESFWDIKTLRHVILDMNPNHDLFKRPIPTIKAETNLPSLQTLEGVEITNALEERSWNMPNLRKLHLMKSEGIWEKIAYILEKKPNSLVDLLLESSCFPEVLINSLRSCKHLQILSLNGHWPSGVDFRIYPPHLTSLTFRRTYIEDNNFIPVLGKLQNLNTLDLGPNAFLGNIICSKGEFPQLQTWTIYRCDLNEWKINKGALPVLKKLYIEYNFNLRELPELQHVTTLSYLLLHQSKDFITRVQNEEQYKIKHIPKVDMIDY